MLYQFKLVLVGGGPAGLAVLLAANKEGRLAEMLQQGLLIVEQSSHIGKGQIGNYAINSDSTGYTFVDPLRFGAEPALRQILATPLAQRIAAAGPNSVPLREVGDLMALIGQAIQSIMVRYPQSAVFTSCTAESTQRLPNGSWQLSATDANGKKLTIHAEQMILATGATQPQSRLERELVAGVSVVRRWGDRLMQSGEVVSLDGPNNVVARLKGISNPRVAILGGSTSAMAAAHLLLNRLPGVKFQQGGITLFHRRPLRVYYTSPQEACADGYTEFDGEDLCPLTSRVYRLAGLRLDSRELLMQLRGIGGRQPEPRMKLHLLQPTDPEAIQHIDSADLVVAALGYRPRGLTILDQSGSEVPLMAHTGPTAPLVDKLCQVMDGNGQPIAGLFGIGLAAGFVPYGKLGGEPSFAGQANGLWLWQNDIGSIIVKSVLPPVSGVGSTLAASAAAKSNPVVDNAHAPSEIRHARRSLDAQIPLAKPQPARLSESVSLLRDMEERAIFSNFGPLNTAFERDVVAQMFSGVGEALTVTNATIGLMVAIRQTLESRPKSRRRYALMPSFTFAATAQAALWNRLTPLFCDINPETWAPDRESEQRLLEKHGDEIAVVVPYATFGYDIDLEWYEEIQRRYGIPVVVDAAASLGTISEDGRGFGTGFSGAIVYSMHVTKAFSTAEGGLIYSGDSQLIKTLRSMTSFGFGEPRNAALMGLNGKMSEVVALLANLRLETFDAVMQRRSALVGLYHQLLPELSFQPLKANRQAHQLVTALLPRKLAASRTIIQAEMNSRGVSSGSYFSPHVAEQDYFRAQADLASLTVTNNISSRVLTMPLYDTMTEEEVYKVVYAVRAALALAEQKRIAPHRLSIVRKKTYDIPAVAESIGTEVRRKTTKIELPGRREVAKAAPASREAEVAVRQAKSSVS